MKPELLKNVLLLKFFLNRIYEDHRTESGYYLER
jgi:hypothetical protein